MRKKNNHKDQMLIFFRKNFLAKSKNWFNQSQNFKKKSLNHQTCGKIRKIENSFICVDLSRNHLEIFKGSNMRLNVQSYPLQINLTIKKLNFKKTLAAFQY